ncbi:MAG: class I SAM-dependent methyltransferase [Planctomycetes bacterium]|jgi:SAM-dependent methyltransferase|nr:class I SAM-dependent methyltransferase [Planctomycetota bacterium]
MMEQNFVLKMLRKIRAAVMPVVRPKWRYFLVPQRQLKPISQKHGYDRGTPIDRYYADKFLGEFQDCIKGRVLEVGNRFYTKKFGGERVTQSDALDIDPRNKRANITSDLRDLKAVADDTYDCFIMTFTIGMIDDYRSALKESRRILKPGGILLALDCLNSSFNPELDYWRLTPNSARLVFGEAYGVDSLEVRTYGNTLSGQYNWVGLAAEELSPAELDFHQERYTIIIGVKAIKKSFDDDGLSRLKRDPKNPEIIGGIY